MRIRVLLALAVAALATIVPAQPPQAVILFTLDGARLEEMFFGIDLAILRAQLKPEQRLEEHELYQRYWAPTPQARREKLMPFFWGTLMRQHGSIAGNPALRSRVHVTNRHWISYPSYSELLIGGGRTPADWSNHHEHTAGAGETWMAFVSPSWSRRGEWRNHEPLTASQVAATLMTWMGGDWQLFTGAAPPVRP